MQLMGIHKILDQAKSSKIIVQNYFQKLSIVKNYSQKSKNIIKNFVKK